MEANMLIVLNSLKDKLIELTASASGINVSLSDPGNNSQDIIMQAEIISTKLRVTLQRLSKEINNFLQISSVEHILEISEITTVQLKAEDILCELDVKLASQKKTFTNQKEAGPVLSKLPKLELPQFHGNILEWHTFWDRYSSNIHNRNLPDVEKMLYLKSSLKGEALKVIEGLDTNNANYTIAIQTLKERYGKPSLVIDAHYSALSKIKRAEDNTADCRRVLDDVERNLRVLNSLGEDINHNHLRSLIMEKFPKNIIYEMQLRIKEETIEEIREHLKTIISAHENAERITKDREDDRPGPSYTSQTLHLVNRGNGNRSKVENLFRGGNRAKVENLFRGNMRFRGNSRPRGIYKHRGNNHQSHSSGLLWRGGRVYFKGTQKNTQHNKDGYKRPYTNNEPTQNGETEGSAAKRTKLGCIFCRGPHNDEDCTIVKTAGDRKKKLYNRCYKCLEEGHASHACQLRRVCVHCASPYHHQALCEAKFGTAGGTARAPESANTLYTNSGSMTVLQTAVATVMNENTSKSSQCRVLMDSGSQRTYVTKAMAKRLNLDFVENNKLLIYTFGSSTPQEIDSPVVKLRLQTRSGKLMDMFANVVPMISPGVAYPEQDLAEWKDKSKLADDGSLKNRVDILIGNDHYFTIISGAKLEIKPNLYLIESDLGLILSGESDSSPINELTVVTYFQSQNEIGYNIPDLPLNNKHLQKLWDLETIGITDSPKDTSEEEAVRKFNETTEFHNNRYHVEWPWKEFPPALTSNFGPAYGRVVNLIKHLDSEAMSSYEETLKNQLDKGVIEIVPSSEHFGTDHPVHYLPHHGVRQPGKPVRIVYDASSKTKDSNSLNQCLYSGPTLLGDLTGLLIKFRCHAIGMCADVEKAFLQIALKERDRDVTRFLWLKDVRKPATKENLLHLRFCRVPFGVISSPFLLNATIKLHLQGSSDQRIKDLANDIYVDNLVTGVQSEKEALSLYKKSKETFDQISMNLREWSSNSKKVMEKIPDTCDDRIVKVLGLNWSLDNDTLQLRRGGDIPGANSKRDVLKVVASVYDPCGYVVPALLSSKLFIQDLWKEKVDWDTPFQDKHLVRWSNIQKDLQTIKDVTIPRRYFRNFNTGECQVHCFTDASIKAYAAAVYVVSENEKTFVIGKSRVVPEKDQEDLKIPRLELLGALIGSRLINYVLRFLQLKVTKQVLWTDSQIVISWLTSNKLLPPFVSRRISEIRKNKDLTVRYVPSELNPADVGTRPDRLQEEGTKWLSGPQFLLQEEELWPTCNITTSLLSREVPPESVEDSDPEDLRLPADLEQDIPRQDKEVDSNIEELKKLQAQHFPEELKGKETDLKRNLDLFSDIDGILRCRGRFKNVDWSYEKRYPVLIPGDSEYTRNVIMKTHNDNYHVGVNHTLSIIRQNFWIPQGRRQVGKVLSRCPNCVKHGGGPFKLPDTPALPPERINYSAPFTFTGLDYLGPVLVKSGNGTNKRWIALFTCLAVRAIHLETVQDLTAEEGLLALRRMIATRGMPALITSDNATNFKLMSEILTSSYCVENKIKWRFIPQLAPWYGGFYERLVGIVKNCMRRTLHKHLLTDSQISTVVKEIEAIVNSRPLTRVDSEVEHILKPSDFIAMGRCITWDNSDKDIPVHGSTTKTDLIAGWKRGLVILEEFKEMFSNRYLMSLRERYKHAPKEPRITSKVAPSIGQVVQIKGDAKNREDWKIGKIVSLPKGADGSIRIAKIDVAGKEFVRSLAHLYPLEMEVEEENNPTNFSAEENRETTDVEMPDLELERVDDTLCIEMPEPIDERNGNPQEKETIPLVNPSNNESCLEVPESRRDRITVENVGGEEIRSERPRRESAVRAAAKIRQWTQSLVSLLVGRECRDKRENLL